MLQWKNSCRNWDKKLSGSSEKFFKDFDFMPGTRAPFTERLMRKNCTFGRELNFHFGINVGINTRHVCLN